MINFDELLDQSAPGYEREGVTIKQYVEKLGMDRVGDVSNFELPLTDFGKPDLTEVDTWKEAHR